MWIDVKSEEDVWQCRLLGKPAVAPGVGIRIGKFGIRVSRFTFTFFQIINVAIKIRNRTFKRSEFGQGGYRADSILTKVRDEVIAQWNALNNAQKKDVIEDLHSFQFGLIAWDISELTFSDKERWTENVRGDVAEDTLTFRGHVFPVAEVNYLLWGLVNRLAYNDGIETDDTNLNWILFEASAYRSVFGGLLHTSEWYSGRLPRFETITGKIAWTAYGWNWAIDPNPPLPIHESLPLARPNRDPWPYVMNFRAGQAGFIDGIVQP